jgi:hypothetical protein
VADADDWSVRQGKRKAGEALFSELKPLEFLAERRKLSTTASWESLYQQSPIIAGGGVFPIERFRIVQSVAFAAATGVPPHRYVSRRRLETARAMIATGRASLSEIALECRFSSQSSFTRAFRRATGMTPAEYRRTLR